jgi:histone acetyltransferase (RNA polymerase elongator complex component)
VGAREYYRAEGYTLEGNYMVKSLAGIESSPEN